ncbi:hypothetical protein [Agarilytica rhodophyticola]|uniref:hypothetical protein n=1 Tax=Agarilytica rhodophyticola TaxID=1737490 RepID=UPI000B34439B|nr:hypothetical protein [Agarilytica rhodophyticola]
MHVLLESMSSLLGVLLNHYQWFFSGIGVPICSYLFLRRLSKKQTDENRNRVLVPQKNDSDSNNNESEQGGALSGSYRTAVGQKHRWLREEILDIKLRDMAIFYGLDEVTQLESYELGNIELPMSLIEKVEDFFFLKPDFIDSDISSIFRSFHLCERELAKLFDKGFSATIACCPYNRDDLLCYIVMHKVENKFTRIISSDLIGSFMSSGGGRMNIQYLINEILDRGISNYHVPILTATEDDWEKLEQKCYYDVNLCHRVGAADRACMDIFSLWYEETVKSRKSYKPEAEFSIGTEY